MPGIKKIICRLRLRNIAFQARPMLWKNWLMMICDPTPKKATIVRTSPRSVMRASSASVVKALTIADGKSKLMIQPSVVIAEAIPIASLSVASTRSYRRAP